MINCVLNYNVHTPTQRLQLECHGVGSYDVQTGLLPHVNDPNCSFLADSAIPVGQYWIIDRPAGSLLNRARAEIIDAWHLYRNHHADWFALYNARTMSDITFVNNYSRGGLRLHPLNSDGSGVSKGCVTLYNYYDFYHLRAELLKTKKIHILGPGGKTLEAYGKINVIRNPDFSKCLR